MSETTRVNLHWLGRKIVAVPDANGRYLISNLSSTIGEKGSRVIKNSKWSDFIEPITKANFRSFSSFFKKLIRS